MLIDTGKSVPRHARDIAIALFLFVLSLAHTPSPSPVRMSFWAAAIPIIASLISAAGGIYASKQAKKKSGTEKNLEGMTLQGLQNLMGMGGPLLQQGQSAIGQYQSFLKPLVSGSRSDMLRHLSPELTAMGESNRAAMQQSANLGPRGGASSDFLSALPFQSQTNISNLISSTRRGAATELGSLGTNLLGMGMNAISGGRSGAMALLDYNSARNARADQYGGDVSNALFNLIQGGYDAYGQYRQRTATPSTTKTGGAASGWSGNDTATGNAAFNLFGGKF